MVIAFAPDHVFEARYSGRPADSVCDSKSILREYGMTCEMFFPKLRAPAFLIGPHPTSHPPTDQKPFAGKYECRMNIREGAITSSEPRLDYPEHVPWQAKHDMR